MPVAPTRCVYRWTLVSLVSITISQAVQADIITTLTGQIGLAPVSLEIETVNAATNVNGIVHVVGQHQGQAARQRVNLATGVASPVELFESIASAPGVGGNVVGKINELQLLADGRVAYVGESAGLAFSDQPTLWFAPDTPIAHVATTGQATSGVLLSIANNGTYVGSSGFVRAVYGSVDSPQSVLLPGFDAGVARDIASDARFIAGGDFLWNMNGLGGYDVMSTSGFDFGITGGSDANWLAVDIDPITNDAVFAGEFFDLEIFADRVGFWRADGTFIGATGIASFSDFEVVDGHLVAAVNGLEDGFLFALTDFSSISMNELLGTPMTVDALYSGSLGFVGRSSSGGMFIGTTTAVPEPSSLLLLATATAAIGYRRRAKKETPAPFSPKEVVRF